MSRGELNASTQTSLDLVKTMVHGETLGEIDSSVSFGWPRRETWGTSSRRSTRRGFARLSKIMIATEGTHLCSAVSCSFYMYDSDVSFLLRVLICLVLLRPLALNILLTSCHEISRWTQLDHTFVAVVRVSTVGTSAKETGALHASAISYLSTRNLSCV